MLTVPPLTRSFRRRKRAGYSNWAEKTDKAAGRNAISYSIITTCSTTRAKRSDESVWLNEWMTGIRCSGCDASVCFRLQDKKPSGEVCLADYDSCAPHEDCKESKFAFLVSSSQVTRLQSKHLSTLWWLPSRTSTGSQWERTISTAGTRMKRANGLRRYRWKWNPAVVRSLFEPTPVAEAILRLRRRRKKKRASVLLVWKTVWRDERAIRKKGIALTRLL